MADIERILIVGGGLADEVVPHCCHHAVSGIE